MNKNEYAIYITMRIQIDGVFKFTTRLCLSCLIEVNYLTVSIVFRFRFVNNITIYRSILDLLSSNTLITFL